MIVETPLRYRFAELLTDRGNFTYNRLTSLQRNKPETVLLKLSLEGLALPILSSVLAGEQVRAETPVTPVMSAELKSSAGIGVDPPVRVTQRRSDAGEASWLWKVTPMAAGEHLLVLRVYAHVDDYDPIAVKTYEDIIKVEVTGWQKVRDFVSEVSPVCAFGVASIPLVWAALAFFRRKRKEK